MSIFRIAPLGTCRIYTPLRRGASRFPYRLSLARSYGFVHSSREVLAQLAVVQGGPAAPKPLWPLVYRPDTADDFPSAPVVTPDLYMIEISSTKHVSVDDVPVQINYLVRYFAEFFAATEQTGGFWKRARGESDAERRVWLDSLPVFAALSPDDRHILARVRQHILSGEEVAADMAAIVDMAGDVPVHFVTHVDAEDAGGQLIPARHKLIMQVVRTAKALDVPCHNPTAAMLKMGQARAMEKGGRDLTHYTPAFSDDLVNRWFRQEIAPLANIKPEDAGEDGDRAGGDSVMAQVDKLIADGDLVTASTTAWAEVRAGERVEEYLRLLAVISARLHDHERVISLLDQVRKVDGGNEEDTRLLMRAHAALGQHDRALRMAEALMADAPETAELLFVCANAAEALGLADKARFYWQRLLAIRAEGTPMPAAWLQAAVRSRWDPALQAGDQDQLNRLTACGGDLLAADVWHMAEQAADAGRHADAAALLAAYLAGDDPEPRLKVWARSQARIWVAQGLKAVGQGDPGAGIPRILAAGLLGSQSAWFERAMRQLGMAIRKRIRAAHAADDHGAVLALVQLAGAHQVSVPGVEALVAWAAVAAGDLAAVLDSASVAAALTTPQAPWADRAVLQLGVEIRDRIRAARTAGDHGAVLALVQLAGAHAVPVPGVDAPVAWAAVAAGNLAAVLDHPSVAVALTTPQAPWVERAVPQREIELRNRIRAARTAGDHGAVLALVQLAGTHAVPVPGVEAQIAWAAMAAGDLTIVMDYLQAVVTAQPTQHARWASQIRQRLGVEIRNHMRAARAAGDHDKVLGLARLAGTHDVLVPGAEALVTWAATATGDLTPVMDYLQAVVAAQPTPRARRQLARTGVKAGAYDVAVAAYAGLAADPTASTDERAGAGAALTKLISASVRFVRERVAQGDLATALTLLRQLAAHATDADARIARERARIRRQLRIELATPLTDSDRTEQLAILVAEEFGDDADLISRAARAMMQTRCYITARRLWQQLVELGEEVERAQSMIVRCDRFLARERLQEAA